MKAISRHCGLITCFFCLTINWSDSLQAAQQGNGRHETKRPQIEVCFVLDTTGSMGGLIQGAKDKIWSIANELMNTDPKPNIKFGLIGYRDRGDNYVTQLDDLTDDIDAIHTKLMAFAAQGGGDFPESVNQAILESVQKISWSDGREVLKIVFLVGDAPPHMDYENDVRYPEICSLAMKKGLIINTIQCGVDSNTKTIWKEIARRSEGQYVAIQQSGGMVAIATPFDAEIAKVNGSLNRTVCGYGDMAIQQSVKEKIASNASSKFEAVADRAEFLSKGRGSGRGGAKVLGGDDDLVEMLIDGRVKMAEIDQAKLPEDVKKLNPEAQQAELKKRIAQRKAAQAKIDDLVKKRADFILQEKSRLAASGKVDSFDEKVKDMIRDQAASKGIDYSKK